MNTIKINSEVSDDFGSYVGCLTLILRVTLFLIFEIMFNNTTF